MGSLGLNSGILSKNNPKADVLQTIRAFITPTAILTLFIHYSIQTRPGPAGLMLFVRHLLNAII